MKGCDSVAAPKSNLIAKPDEWSTTVRKAADVYAKALTVGQQAQVGYWTSFAAFVSD